MIDKLTTVFIIALAVVAAIVATGLISGYSMWAWIVAYWIILTAKNSLDCVKRIGSGKD